MSSFCLKSCKFTLLVSILHYHFYLTEAWNRRKSETFGKPNSQDTNEEGPNSSHCISHQQEMLPVPHTGSEKASCRWHSCCWSALISFLQRCCSSAPPVTGMCSFVFNYSNTFWIYLFHIPCFGCMFVRRYDTDIQLILTLGPNIDKAPLKRKTWKSYFQTVDCDNVNTH